MQNNVLGLSGSVFAFESKAEALKWAIEFTAGWASPDERLVRYEQAQELYDFICRNVQLPDTKNASMDDFFASASSSLAGLKSKIDAVGIGEPLEGVASHISEPDGSCCLGEPDGPCCVGEPDRVVGM